MSGKLNALDRPKHPLTDHPISRMDGQVVGSIKGSPIGIETGGSLAYPISIRNGRSRTL
ncbi:hypothetical protein [Coleofasciculus sp. H7-2]|uniref:hypothetical protein n=1 Tax=Coleofasciculus sp. H7-2 TaxID=3351545 RepID=UPI00366D0C8D